MFEKKNILFLLATAALVAACGGGGGDTQTADAGTQTGVNPPANDAGTGGTPPAAGDPGGSGGTPPPATDGSGDDGTPPPDQMLAGRMEVVANQILYIRVNRVIYLPVVLTAFESDRGVVDVASGSKVPDPEIDVVGNNCNIAIDGTCGIVPPAVAPAAPIAAFGIRVDKVLQPTAPGQIVGNQTAVGRIAVELIERDDSPGILANEVAEIMRYVIDRVEMTTDARGELVAVRMLEGARMHVYGRNAAGVEVRESIPVPTGAVRLLPVSQIPDHNGDTTSVVLFMDFETAFSQAGARLAALENIAGHFAMNLTMSSVSSLLRPAAAATSEFPAVGRKELVGETITVNNQPPVSGAGISGNIWIRMYPF